MSVSSNVSGCFLHTTPNSSFPRSIDLKSSRHGFELFQTTSPHWDSAHGSLEANAPRAPVCLQETCASALINPFLLPGWPCFHPPAKRWPTGCSPGRCGRWWRSWWGRWPGRKPLLCPDGTGPPPNSAPRDLRPRSWRLWTRRGNWLSPVLMLRHSDFRHNRARVTIYDHNLNLINAI